MKNINIPEPCSENWNEMTPTEKGAFCKKCALDVYDFTYKSSDEIRGILTQNIGSRVCGHINPSQLHQLNADFEMWQVKDKRSFQRVWVFSLFVVFGMTLFSCNEDEKPAVENLQKIGQMILTESSEETTKQVETQNKQDNSKKVGLEAEQAEISNLHKQEANIRGMVSYDNEVQIQEHQADSSSQLIADPFYYTRIDGGMMWSEDYENYLIETQIEEITDQKNTNEAEEITGLIYPNPAVNQTTLKVNLPNKGKGEIELFALSGQKIKTIHAGRLQKGENTFNFDVTELETGNYLVVIYVDGKKETVQFSKL